MERPGVAGAGGGGLQPIPKRIPDEAHFDLTSENGRLPAILSSPDYVRFTHSCSSCSKCLQPLNAMNFAVQSEHDRQLFAFEDEFDRLSDLHYLDDDDDDDDNGEGDVHELSRAHAQLASGPFGANGPPRNVDELIPNPLNARIFSFPTHLEKQLMASNEDRATNTMDSILTTTTMTTDNDSGIGRTTDESVRAEDSNCSEQEMAENFQRPVWLSWRDAGALTTLTSPSVCRSPIRRCSCLLERNCCEEFDAVNQGFQQMQLLWNSMTDCCLSNGTLLSFCNKVGKLSVCSQQRIVPRMGTRRNLFRTDQKLSPIPQEPQSYSPVNEPSPALNDDHPVWIRQTEASTNESNLRKANSTKRDDVLDAEKYFITGDCTACGSGCNTPAIQHEAKTRRLDDEKTKPTDLTSPSSSSKQMTISEDNILTAIDPDSSKSLNFKGQAGKQQDDNKQQSEDQPHSLQQLYSQYVDVMYTNRTNLEHTIMVQQKLFEQQIRLNSQNKQTNSKPNLEIHQTVQATGSWNDDHHAAHSSSSGVPMEWVLRRRPDGSRYVTRRPIRRQILRERAQQLAEERCGITTDDDSKSELKLGRYWSRDKRKLHLEQARNHRQQKELIQKGKMETVRENGDQPTIIELSKRKAMRHKNKRIMDNFVTVQEMLAHGSHDPFGHKSNPLLSVTTV